MSFNLFGGIRCTSNLGAFRYPRILDKKVSLRQRLERMPMGSNSTSGCIFFRTAQLKKYPEHLP